MTTLKIVDGANHYLILLAPVPSSPNSLEVHSCWRFYPGRTPGPSALLAGELAAGAVGDAEQPRADTGHLMRALLQLSEHSGRTCRLSVASCWASGKLEKPKIGTQK